MVKKEVKNRVGRPKETTVKSGRISVRFSEDEMKQIKLYLTKHKIESILDCVQRFRFPGFEVAQILTM